MMIAGRARVHNDGDPTIQDIPEMDSARVIGPDSYRPSATAHPMSAPNSAPIPMSKEVARSPP